MILTLGISTEASSGAAGASAGVKRVLGGDVLAQHDHPVLQVTDWARCAAGGTVQTPLWAKLPFEAQHCSNGHVHSTKGFQVSEVKMLLGYEKHIKSLVAFRPWLYPWSLIISNSLLIVRFWSDFCFGRSLRRLLAAAVKSLPVLLFLYQERIYGRARECTCVLLQPVKHPVNIPPGQPFLKWVWYTHIDKEKALSFHIKWCQLRVVHVIFVLCGEPPCSACLSVQPQRLKVVLHPKVVCSLYFFI